MEDKTMTNEQYQDAKVNAIKTILYELLDEVETEYDPEIIKAKIRAKIKEVSQTANQN